MKIAVWSLTVIILFSSCSLMNKNKNESNSTFNKDISKSPSLTAPRVSKVWVPEKIEGDKFIEGHYMWILEKTTSWSQ